MLFRLVAEREAELTGEPLDTFLGVDEGSEEECELEPDEEVEAQDPEEGQEECEEEEKEDDDCVEVPLVNVPATPATKVHAQEQSPKQQHDAIRPSPTAAPSGMQAKRQELWDKLAKIRALRAELGLSSLNYCLASSCLVF